MVGLRTSQIVIKKYVCKLYVKSILILINSSEGVRGETKYFCCGKIMKGT